MKALDIRINEKYGLQCKVGEGGSGVVYSGINLDTGEEVALKLEHIMDGDQMLRNEAQIYDELKGGIGIPDVSWYGRECEYDVLVFDLLGPSLEDLFNFCDRKFSLKTVLLLADQLISRIEYVHSKSYIHGDVKPGNFLMGTGKLGNRVYAIDFNIAKQYQDPETGEHLFYHENSGFEGTNLFASINNHLGIRQSRRDDLESLGYTMIYFALGSLPWERQKAKMEDEERELVKAQKVNTSIEDLCRSLPGEFASYLSYVRKLAFDERPNYSYLRKLFRDLFARKGFEYDNVFDWTVKKFFMIRDSMEQSAPNIEVAASQEVNDSQQIPSAPSSPQLQTSTTSQSLPPGMGESTSADAQPQLASCTSRGPVHRSNRVKPRKKRPRPRRQPRI